jgi:hypothetical protein
VSTRRLATSSVLAVTVLTLTLSACGPDRTTASGPGSTAPATGAAAVSPAPSADAAASGAKPSAKPTAAPGSGSAQSPAADCTAQAHHPGHKVINATVAWGSPNRIGFNETKFVCGPDVPNDGYYEAAASSPDALTFAPGATAQLLAGVQAKDVSVDRLLQQINACTTQNASSMSPYSCYGNMYDVTLDANGKITQIRELYHP